jgi:hypothetical protein
MLKHLTQLSLRAAVLFALLPTHAVAASTLSFGGRLIESSGRPVAGPVTLNISLWDQVTGGNRVYEFAALQNTALESGVFQVKLQPNAGEESIFQQVLKTGSLFIAVTDATHNRAYPRQQFTAVPFALRVPVDGRTLAFNNDGELAVLSSAQAGPAGPAGAPGAVGPM